MEFLSPRLTALLLLAPLLVLHAAAFQTGYVEVNIGEEGDASVQVDYSLNWVEYFGVFLGIANPAEELKKGLEEYSGTRVDVTSVSGESASFHVAKFARVSETGERRVYTTPALTFSDAEMRLQSYWFAPLISPDLSPEMTVIRFPDGYVEIYRNESRIPAVAHLI